jgi:hypothetical protein
MNNSCRLWGKMNATGATAEAIPLSDVRRGLMRCLGSDLIAGDIREGG